MMTTSGRLYASIALVSAFNLVIKSNQDTFKTLIIGLKPEFLFEARLDKTSLSLNRDISLNLAATLVHLGWWSSGEYVDNLVRLPTYSPLNSNNCFLRILLPYKPKGGDRPY